MSFKFDIVTPEKKLLSEQAELVVVPGVEGDFGVMAQHAPLISAVRPGVVAVYKGDKVIEAMFVSGGFAEVNKEGLCVLADEAIKTDEINLEEATEKLKEAKDRLEQLSGALDSPEHIQEKAQAERRVKIYSAMVEAANDHA